MSYQRSLLFAVCLLSAHAAIAQSDFKVPPYLQNPDFSGVSILWFTRSDVPGTVTVLDENGVVASLQSSPIQASALAYPTWEIGTHPDEFPGGVAPPPPYRHRVRFDNLEWNKEYTYVVSQGVEQFQSTFRTAPGILKPIKFQ